MIYRGLTVAALASLVLTACGTSTTISTQDATSYFRKQSAEHYAGTVATTDGRGCAQQTTGRWICTAYVKEPGIDVYGTVTVQDGNMTVNAHENRGSETTDWFAQTGGGCKTEDCADTNIP